MKTFKQQLAEVNTEHFLGMYPPRHARVAVVMLNTLVSCIEEKYPDMFNKIQAVGDEEEKIWVANIREALDNARSSYA